MCPSIKASLRLCMLAQSSQRIDEQKSRKDYLLQLVKSKEQSQQRPSLPPSLNAEGRRETNNFIEPSADTKAKETVDKNRRKRKKRTKKKRKKVRKNDLH